MEPTLAQQTAADVIDLALEDAEYLCFCRDLTVHIAVMDANKMPLPSTHANDRVVLSVRKGKVFFAKAS